MGRTKVDLRNSVECIHDFLVRGNRTSCQSPSELVTFVPALLVPGVAKWPLKVINIVLSMNE